MGGRTVIAGARVFDGTGLSTPRTVVLDGAVIASIGADEPAGVLERVDAAGAVLLPGFIDAHVHLADEDSLHALAAHGVTTGLDMGCWPPSLVDRLRGASGGADARFAGPPAIGESSPHSRIPGLPGDAVLRTPQDARRFVADRVAARADYVKLVLEAPGEGGPDPDSAAALVAAAHGAGLLVVAHAPSVGAYELALLCGADIVTHMPVHAPLPDELVTRLATGGRAVVPTLAMMAGFAEAYGVADGLATALAGTRAAHLAGVPVLAGTDANALPSAPDVRYGVDLHRELELLVRAGLSEVDALRAATSAPARHFGMPDRGAVAEGLRADLVLVDGDPLADIRATRNVVRVWCAGVSR